MSFTKFAFGSVAAVVIATAAGAGPITVAASAVGPSYTADRDGDTDEPDGIGRDAPGSTSTGGSQVPAPGALWLFAAGLAALGWRIGRRRD